MRNNKQLGILLMIVSTFCFAAMSVVVKLSGGRIPLMEQVFVRNAVSLVIAIVLVRKRHVSYFGELRFQPYLFGRSFFGFLGVIALFYASNHAAQADVSILSKMSPFVTTLLAFLFLKEKISKVQIAALIIAFVGAFIVANPSFNSNVWPLVVAFLCALCSGVAHTMLSVLGGKADAMTVILHFSTFSMVAALPFMIADFVMPNFTEFILLLLIGVFAAGGQVSLTYAFRMAPASEVSIFDYAGIIFSSLLGYLILGESLTAKSIIGGLLIILASAMVFFYNRRAVSQQPTRNLK